nr:penicillin-binding protein 2 [Solirubrobacterales bacterium]
MNRQITRLFALVVLLFALLVAFTSRWTVFEASELEANAANRRGLLEQQRVPRGRILARDGSVLASSVGAGRRENRRYSRTYPLGDLFGHPLGYSFVDRGQAGLDQSLDPELTGDDDELSTIVKELSGDSVRGNDVRTTLDPGAQRVAMRALGGRAGSIVAMEPRTGRIRVMVSTPGYDPNTVPERYRELNTAAGSPLLNRATQGTYPPGSTFKVVTAAAALDSGRFRPASIVDGSSPKTISGRPLSNFGDQDYGPITLTDALTNSVNTVWAEVATRLGGETMADYMERFGFGKVPPIDYPRDQTVPSGLFNRGRLLEPADRRVDLGRMAIGQERLQVTPLQMATVAATVANRGSRMEPQLVERVVDRDGRVVDQPRPAEAAQVMGADSAAELTEMMSKVVEEGSGTAAALEGGIRVAGKTGTAEVDSGSTNQAWFIGFGPVDRPRMA